MNYTDEQIQDDLVMAHIYEWATIKDKTAINTYKKMNSICTDIGCSGIDSNCPDNKDCSIIRKINGDK